jgi:tetratricopeptide (TPR) repeat protein
MDDNPLTEKFPDLQPGRVPTLGNVLGFGTALAGRRDYDPETGTYVTTHCVTALFIPLFSIGAYRVADTPHGKYCLGKVPLSGFARRMNVAAAVLLVCAVGGIGWGIYTTTPEYAAKQKLKAADRAAAAGQGGEAARLCREVMDGKTKYADDARQKLAVLIEDPPGPPSEAAAVYTVAIDLHRENRCPVVNLFDSGKAVAARFADSDPAAALDLLEVIAPFAHNVDAELSVRRELLEKLFARNPNDPATASRLAVVYEAKGESERCEKLLVPFEKQLGGSDGAAILGRICAARGEYDRAHALLRPFVDAKLPLYAQAITDVQAAQDRVLDSLRSGKAPGFDYDRVERLPKAQQHAAVNDYINDQLRTDPALRDARKRLTVGSRAVSAALDLGLVQLQRGQAMADPVARKVELEAAEKTFLSVRGFAGEEAGYQLRLAQVYYWLGRQAEGKKLFDEFVAGQGGASAAVLRVSGILREVGDETAARRMAEEAYQKETDQARKYAAAIFRAVMFTDVDDEITWLGRANPDDPHVQASLNTARGTKAEQDGRHEDAAGHFRKAIELYDKMPENATTLNNSSIAHFALFGITHDRAEFTRGADKLDRAIALQPSDSILLLNGAGSVLNSAAIEVIGPAIDFRALRQMPGAESLSYLYRGAAERAAVVDRYLRHPGTVKARTYADKLMIVAPKRPSSYTTLNGILIQARDLEGQKALLAKVEKADLDLVTQAREYQEYISGKSDAKRIGDFRKGVARAAEVLAAVKGHKDRTFAVAVGRYVRTKYAAWHYGEAVDADELVRLAEEAHAAVPSDGTEGTLATALIQRAHGTLTREDAAYARLADKTKRSLGTWLVYYVLATDGPLRSKAVANADVKRLAARALEEFRLDPDGSGPMTWILLRAALPAEAEAVAAKVKANERLRVRQRIEYLLSPYSANEALDEYMWLLLDGKEAEAKKVLAGLAAKGIPVP